jgi:hypothetical protein
MNHAFKLFSPKNIRECAKTRKINGGGEERQLRHKMSLEVKLEK